MSEISATSAASSSILCVEGIGYVWKSLRESRRALANISAEFRNGLVNFICGPSGAGKSTLGLLVGGLIEPSEGHALLNGQELAKQRKRVAYVFQFPETIFFSDTVREELIEISGAKVEAENPAAFEALGVSYAEIKDRHPHLLSEGFARLTALALQMSREADLLILDEPTIGLDWKHQERVIAALKQFVSGQRIVIIISHDLDLLEALGGQTWILNDGALAWQGPTAELLQQDELLRRYSLLA